MAFYATLINFLVVILIASLGDECHPAANSQSTLRPTSFKHGIYKSCLRLCEWDIQHQKNRKLKDVASSDCIRDCQQGKTLRVLRETSKLNVASMKLRRKRASGKAQTKKCHGVFSKHVHVGMPVPTEILNVAYKAGISSGDHQYNISWRPFDEATIKIHNWTHYSLFYKFRSDDIDRGQGMDCKLIPKNKTHQVLKHLSLRQPDELLSTVVSFPFNSNKESRIKLQAFPKINPEEISTFVPFFTTTKALRFNVAIPIAGVSGALLIVLMLGILMWRRRAISRFQDPVRHEAIQTRANNRAEPAATVNLPSNTENSNELYYSCYYPETDAFRQQVASIVNKFRENGYNVIMDAMVSHEISSLGPTKWAEEQIRKAKKVLVFLSPGLLKLSLGSNEGSQSEDVSRVWIELEVLRCIYHRSRSAAKTVCLELPDMPVSSMELPVFLKVIYKWPRDFEKILRDLIGRPPILPN